VPGHGKGPGTGPGANPGSSPDPVRGMAEGRGGLPPVVRDGKKDGLLTKKILPPPTKRWKKLYHVGGESPSWFTIIQSYRIPYRIKHQYVMLIPDWVYNMIEVYYDVYSGHIGTMEYASIVWHDLTKT